MHFDRYAAYLADCEEALAIHYHIRHAVYCERKGFEAPAAANTPREEDVFDRHASHFIFRHRLTRNWHGAARLVRRFGTPLPVETLGGLAPQWREVIAASPSAEVSRLSSVSTAQLGWETTQALLQTSVAAVVENSLRLRVDWLVFLVAPAMARMLTRMDLPIEPCGPSVHHRGVRRAYAVHIRDNLPKVGWLQRTLNEGTVCRSYAARGDVLADPAVPAAAIA